MPHGRTAATNWAVGGSVARPVRLTQARVRPRRPGQWLWPCQERHVQSAAPPAAAASSLAAREPAVSRRRGARESAGEARGPRDGRSTAPQGHPRQTTRANRPPAPRSPGLPQTSRHTPPPPAVGRGSPAARVCCARATATSGARAARGAPLRGPAAPATLAEARPTPRAPAALRPHFLCRCCLQILGKPETRGFRAAAIAVALLGAGGSAAAAGRRHARSLQLAPARSSLCALFRLSRRSAGVGVKVPGVPGAPVTLRRMSPVLGPSGGSSSALASFSRCLHPLGRLVYT